jgi:hypothetical protein
MQAVLVIPGLLYPHLVNGNGQITEGFCAGNKVLNQVPERITKSMTN